MLSMRGTARVWAVHSMQVAWELFEPYPIQDRSKALWHCFRPWMWLFVRMQSNGWSRWSWDENGVVFRKLCIVNPMTNGLDRAFGLLYKKELVIGLATQIDWATPMVGVVGLYGSWVWSVITQ